MAGNDQIVRIIRATGVPGPEMVYGQLHPGVEPAPVEAAMDAGGGAGIRKRPNLYSAPLNFRFPRETLIIPRACLMVVAAPGPTNG